MHHNLEPKQELLHSPEIWFQAITATLLISAAPVFILLFIPVNNASQNKNLLNILLAFAMGGLLGDVFLHLLPHSFGENHDHDHIHEHTHEHEHENEHEHEHEHEHSNDTHEHSIEGLMIGIWIIAGIFIFLIVEKTIRNLTGGHGHSHSNINNHSNNNDKTKGNLRNRKDKQEKKDKKENNKHDKHDKKSNTPQSKNNDNDTSHEHVSKVSGFLNLAADFTHNFTDGLAIGATFVAGERMGMITTIAILLHEVPHEIGDFAILVHSGFTKWQAMKLQFLTAIGALLGTIIGILTGGLTSASNIILPLTAGGFIYISTVSVIPELLEDSSKFLQTILEISAACLGVGFMTIIALIE